MGALSSSSSHVILHHIFRPPSPPPSSLLSFFLFKPLSIPLQTTPLRTTSPFFFTSLSSRPLVFSQSLSSSPSLSLPSSPPHSVSFSDSETQTPVKDTHEYNTVDAFDDDDDDDEIETVDEDFESGKETVSDGSERVLNSSLPAANNESVSKLPSLTVKEKKELVSYAHSLGKKLKSQQVGKSGVTDSVATSLVETLEANELLKVKIHGTCPGELDDAVKQLEEATGSVVVGQIGRTVILYRPSLTKLKAEEKKKLARRVFVKKQLALNPSSQNKGQVVRLSGRGRRGSSRL